MQFFYFWTIISLIRSEEIAITEIQRPFVWKASKVRDLFDFLYKGYPVGYIVIWRSPEVKLKDGSRSEANRYMVNHKDTESTKFFRDFESWWL